MEVVLREALGFGKPLLNREKGLILNVRVMGRESRNGRTYSDEAIQQLRENIEKLGCYTNHPVTDSNDRAIEDRLGGYQNPRIDPKDGSLWTDIKYVPVHPSARLLEYYAENDTPGVGLSLNARGSVNRGPDGRAVVTRLTKIFSVDFVDNPATNTSLRESTSMNLNATAAPTFDAQLGELAKSITTDTSLDKAAKRKKLLKVLAMLDEPAAEGEKPATMEDAAIMEALREIPLPAARAAALRLDNVILRERGDARVKLAKEKGLKDEALTETFREQLTRAGTDAEVNALVLDRLDITRKHPVSTVQTVGGAPAKSLNDVKNELFAA